jgi:hypothetical protein
MLERKGRHRDDDEGAGTDDDEPAGYGVDDHDDDSGTRAGTPDPEGRAERIPA